MERNNVELRGVGWNAMGLGTPMDIWTGKALWHHQRTLHLRAAYAQLTRTVRGHLISCPQAN